MESNIFLACCFIGDKLKMISRTTGFIRMLYYSSWESKLKVLSISFHERIDGIDMWFSSWFSSVPQF